MSFLFFLVFDCCDIFCTQTDGERVSEYEMKLMDIDSEHLGIPVSLF